MKKILPLFLFIAFLSPKIKAQDSLKIDSTQYEKASLKISDYDVSHQFTYKKLIVPSVLISYGVASLSFQPIRHLNISIKTEILEHKPDHVRLDNYTQYAPAAIVYGLNAFGVKGEHNLRDRSIILGTSLLFTTAFVVPLKHIVKEERPDQTNTLSFPSGHTATAFATAQFMYREYKNTNIILGVSGYSLAIFTGVYRMLNNKHWFGDVVAGAGFGILSTELAYWLYPKINNLLGGKKENVQVMITPFYQKGSAGIGFVKTF